MSGTLTRLLVSIILKMGDIIKSDKIILRIYKAHPAARGELNEIKEKVNILSSRAMIKSPSLYLTEAPLPSSIIIGKNQKETVLVFPKRVLNIMKPDQIEAMLAYNLIQIDDNIRIRTFVVLAAGLLTMSSYAIRWGAVFMGFGDYNDPAPRLFGAFIMGLVAPAAAIMTHSVTKYNYDSETVSLYRNNESLVSAIQCLEDNNVTAYPSLGFLCLVDPQKDNFFEHLFNAHPSKETRIKNLRGKGR